MLTSKRIGLFIASMTLWVMLAGVSQEELILGAVVSLLISLVFGKTSSYIFDLKWFIRIPLFIVMYIPIFLIELIKSNLDVMMRVLNPKMPINPGFIRVPTMLTSDVTKLILSNSITLTPGTITLDANEEGLLVHWIDVKMKDGIIDASAVSEPFESLLWRLFK